jgi:hypothetical protein
VVDDEVGHNVQRTAESLQVRPTAQAGIDREVVGGVEAGVRAVVRPEERQHMHSAEVPGEWTLQQPGERRQRPAEPVGVRDQLNLVPHAHHVNPSAAPDSSG